MKTFEQYTQSKSEPSGIPLMKYLNYKLDMTYFIMFDGMIALKGKPESETWTGAHEFWGVEEFTLSELRDYLSKDIQNIRRLSLSRETKDEIDYNNRTIDLVENVLRVIKNGTFNIEEYEEFVESEELGLI